MQLATLLGGHGPLLEAHVASVGAGLLVALPHALPRLDYFGDVGGRSDHGVYEARVAVDTDVSLVAEVPVAALLGLVGLRVAGGQDS